MFGDTAYTGNITFGAATPASTPGTSVSVLESTTGAGQIILEEESNGGIGIDDPGGPVSVSPGTGGIQATLLAGGVVVASRLHRHWNFGSHPWLFSYARLPTRAGRQHSYAGSQQPDQRFIFEFGRRGNDHAQLRRVVKLCEEV